MIYKKTLRAERDLKGIYHYTFRNFGETQANKYLLELDAVFELLAGYPNIGRVYKGRTFQFVHGKHIILYRREGGDVLIGRIFHAARRRR